MFKGLKKMSEIIRILAIIVIMALLSGCGAEKSREITQEVSVIQEQDTDRSSEKAEEYRKYLESIQSVRKETISDPNVE